MWKSLLLWLRTCFVLFLFAIAISFSFRSLCCIRCIWNSCCECYFVYSLLRCVFRSWQLTLCVQPQIWVVTLTGLVFPHYFRFCLFFLFASLLELDLKKLDEFIFLCFPKSILLYGKRKLEVGNCNCHLRLSVRSVCGRSCSFFVWFSIFWQVVSTALNCKSSNLVSGSVLFIWIYNSFIECRVVTLKFS